MKVKDLISSLMCVDQEAEVVLTQYNGSFHAVRSVEAPVILGKGTRFPSWDGDSDTEAVDASGITTTNVVFL